MAAPRDPFSSSPFKTADYDPEPIRENIRGYVTLAAAVTFFAVVAFYLFEAGNAGDGAWVQIKEAMQSVLPAVTSVLGTVLGFYLGRRSDDDHIRFQLLLVRDPMITIEPPSTSSISDGTFAKLSKAEMSG